eukprot:TRINITY_DN38760_c0_g1_i1.p1 TRINITY_DN38760_c0_g1~~TRINITY_DN38760_c0_g1_i1.p1  ORF type:complete len:435 (-),score=-1.29 TRINITY_DN38760_c0_g1_i1:711-2015(-)
MPYVGSHGVAALRKYKYSGVDWSYTSRYLLQPFWSQCILYMPRWVAPNLITLSGLVFLLLSCFLSWYYSPSLSVPLPNWLCFVNGLFLFLYQTLDALDGKQARRTGSSGPLGELFDHGCDALALTLTCLSFGATVLHGSGQRLFFSWLLAATVFFYSTWETYFTHTLRLPVLNGPTEGLILMYMAEFWTAFSGAEWWLQDFRHCLGLPRGMVSYVPFLRMNEAVLWAFGTGSAVTVVSSIITAYKSSSVSHSVVTDNEVQGPQTHPETGFDRQTKLQQTQGHSRLYPLLLMLPYIVLTLLHFIWFELFPSESSLHHPFLRLFAIGLAFAVIVGRLILARLVEEYDGLLLALWMPSLSLALGVGSTFVGRLRQVPGNYDGAATRPNEYWILVAHFLFTFLLYCHFVQGVIYEICVAQNIYCFRLGKRKRKEAKAL